MSNAKYFYFYSVIVTKRQNLVKTQVCSVCAIANIPMRLWHSYLEVAGVCFQFDVWVLKRQIFKRRKDRTEFPSQLYYVFRWSLYGRTEDHEVHRWKRIFHSQYELTLSATKHYDTDTEDWRSTSLLAKIWWDGFTLLIKSMTGEMTHSHSGRRLCGWS